MKKSRWILTWLLAAQLQLHADVTPSGMFGDHMVLQRDMPVPVWGTADPGENVTLEFAGHKLTTKTGADGKWMLALPALEASADGRELTIKGSNTLSFQDVLVGEVWVCSGQSNMQYGWGKESHPMFNWGGDADLAALAPDARTKPIRSYRVPCNVSFTPNDDCAGEWSTDLPGSAVAFGFSYHLQKALQVPVAVVVTCWGSSSIEGWMPRDMTAQLPHFKAIMEAFDGSQQARERVSSVIEKGVRHGNVFVRKQPNLLYNAMLHPVIPYACRGMVWYQGEANANKPDDYAQSLPLWVKRLRKGWGREDFHFLAVMLPGYGTDNGRPDANSWAWFREAQMKVLDLPHTGVANTIDLGDAKNIHPPDKAPIGERLALLAGGSAYHEKSVDQGPAYKAFSVSGDKMTIKFSHANGLKTSDTKPPTGFWLADKEKSWHPATAKIEDGTVLLQAAGIESPAACRYAFCGKPQVNLVNKEGLPAYPFRTDDWPR